MPRDWASEEFADALRQASEWVTTYRATLSDQRVSPAIRPGIFSAKFPPQLPDQPTPFSVLLDQFRQDIVPAVLHWGHPAFLAYFGSTTTGPGIVAELLAAGLNVSAMTWQTSPAATELETVVLGWLRDMLGLPSEFSGIVYDTASVGLAHALSAAREQVRPGTRRNGLSKGSKSLRLYASDQAHSSLEKAAILLGLGETNVIRVATDEAFRLRPEALEEAIQADCAEGHEPMAVIATVGTTSTAAVDPLRSVAAICRRHHLWMHVDAAYGGAMALLPEGRPFFDGAEEADSIVINPHKWLFVPLDFSVLFVKRPDILRAVFALVPEYLAGDASKSDVNYMDYGIQLGRRFRALKAWMVWRSFGRSGIEAFLREHLRLAALVGAWLEADHSFERMAPASMAVQCFRAKFDGTVAQIDAFNETLLSRLNDSGSLYLTTTRLRGRVVLRLAVGNILTNEEVLRQAWLTIQKESQRLRSERQ